MLDLNDVSKILAEMQEYAENKCYRDIIDEINNCWNIVDTSDRSDMSSAKLMDLCKVCWNTGDDTLVSLADDLDATLADDS